MSSLRLLLIRHAQTTANVGRIMDSRPPGHPLTAEGRMQAEDLAEALAAEPIVAVYASRTFRAQDTAAPVATRHGLDVRVLDGVHEVQLGELEGKDSPDAFLKLESIFFSWLEGDLELRIPGGETGHEVLERYLVDVRRIRAAHTDGVVVLVSHGAAIRLSAAHLDVTLDADMANSAFIPNTGYVVLEADPVDQDSWRCLEWTGIQIG